MEHTNTYKKRWLIFLAITMTTFINCIDSSSVNVALPVMSMALHVSMSQIEWVVTAYMIVIICLILIFGKLGDTVGQDKVFKAGIIGVIIGATICFFSSSFSMLMAGRVVQGIGGACTMANSQGLIVKTFPAHERGKAMGLNGSSVALGSMIGPSLGGVIVNYFNWNYIFLLDIPLLILCFALCSKYLPKSEPSGERFNDVPGALLFMVMIVCIYAGIKTLQKGQNFYMTCLAVLFVAVVVGIIFSRRELHCNTAMIDLHIFDNKLFTVSVFCAFISFFAIMGHNFITPFYLQKVQLLNAAQTGLLMMAYSVTMAILAPVSGQLSDKIGSEIICFVGLCIVTVALVILSTMGVGTSVGVFLVGSVLMSAGMAMFQSPNTSLIMSTVQPNQTGVAGSINSLARNLGQVFGISLSTVILYNLMSGRLGYMVLDYVEGEEQVFVYAMHWVYLFMAMCSTIGATLTGLRWMKGRKKTDE